MQLEVFFHHDCGVKLGHVLCFSCFLNAVQQCSRFEHENGRAHMQSVLLLVDLFETLVQRGVNKLWFVGCDL